MILNLTQHPATPEQKAAGVVDVKDHDDLKRALTIQVSGEDGYAESSIKDLWLNAVASQIISRHVMSTQVERRRKQMMNITADSTDLEILNASHTGLSAMLGGFTPLVVVLAKQLQRLGITPLVALSDRVSEEETQADGTVKKVSRFVHCGFDVLRV